MQYRRIAVVAIVLLLSFATSQRLSREAVSDEEGGPSETGEAIYKIEGVIRGPADLTRASTKVHLHGDTGVREASVWQDGSFKFSFLPPGSYLLEVVSTQYHFDVLRVYISAKAHGKVKATVFGDTRHVAYPLILRAGERVQYFEEHKPYDFVGLVTKNPMIIMIGASMIMMVILPKMMGSIDPEVMQQVQQGGLSALINPQEPSTPPAQPAAGSSNTTLAQESPERGAAGRRRRQPK